MLYVKASSPVSKTEESKIGRFSLGGKYSLINIIININIVIFLKVFKNIMISIIYNVQK
jgi:hypothetical protein